MFSLQPPLPHGPWKGTLNATKVHSVCPQRDIYRRSEVFEGEEDCLYLNVYTPQVRSHICFEFGNSAIRILISGECAIKVKKPSHPEEVHRNVCR